MKTVTVLLAVVACVSIAAAQCPDPQPDDEEDVLVILGIECSTDELNITHIVQDDAFIHLLQYNCTDPFGNQIGNGTVTESNDMDNISIPITLVPGAMCQLSGCYSDSHLDFFQFNEETCTVPLVSTPAVFSVTPSPSMQITSNSLTSESTGSAVPTPSAPTAASTSDSLSSTPSASMTPLLHHASDKSTITLVAVCMLVLIAATVLLVTFCVWHRQKARFNIYKQHGFYISHEVVDPDFHPVKIHSKLVVSESMYTIIDNLDMKYREREVTHTQHQESIVLTESPSTPPSLPSQNSELLPQSFLPVSAYISSPSVNRKAHVFDSDSSFVDETSMCCEGDVDISEIDSQTFEINDTCTETNVNEHTCDAPHPNTTEKCHITNGYIAEQSEGCWSAGNQLHLLTEKASRSHYVQDPSTERSGYVSEQPLKSEEDRIDQHLLQLSIHQDALVSTCSFGEAPTQSSSSFSTCTSFSGTSGYVSNPSVQFEETLDECPDFHQSTYSLNDDFQAASPALQGTTWTMKHATEEYVQHDGTLSSSEMLTHDRPDSVLDLDSLEIASDYPSPESYNCKQNVIADEACMQSTIAEDQSVKSNYIPHSLDSTHLSSGPVTSTDEYYREDEPELFSALSTLSYSPSDTYTLEESLQTETPSACSEAMPLNTNPCRGYISSQNLDMQIGSPDCFNTSQYPPHKSEYISESEEALSHLASNTSYIYSPLPLTTQPHNSSTCERTSSKVSTTEYQDRTNVDRTELPMISLPFEILSPDMSSGCLHSISLQIPEPHPTMEESHSISSYLPPDSVCGSASMFTLSDSRCVHHIPQHLPITYQPTHSMGSIDGYVVESGYKQTSLSTPDSGYVHSFTTETPMHSTSITESSSSAPLTDIYKLDLTTDTDSVFTFSTPYELPQTDTEQAHTIAPCFTQDIPMRHTLALSCDGYVRAASPSTPDSGFSQIH